MEHAHQPMTSTKPYLIRAIYDWILDNQMTPHLVVDVSYPDVMVPQDYVEEGRLVLNLSPGAVRDLVLGNERIELNARFGGVARVVAFPVEAVLGIFTRENGQGMVFPEAIHPAHEERAPAPDAGPNPQPPPRKPTTRPSGPKPPADKGAAKGRRPTLKVVK